MKKQKRLKRIIHNDSSNSSLPPSTDQNGKPACIRNQSCATSVLYSPMEKKNLETLKETGILSRFSGTLMHDHETAMYHFGTGNGECKDCLKSERVFSKEALASYDMDYDAIVLRGLEENKRTKGSSQLMV